MSDVLTPLGAVWLEELNLYHRYLDDATAEERSVLARRANAAANKVENQFAEMTRTGQFKGLNRSYKNYRAACRQAKRDAMSWPAYTTKAKRKMTRLLAREQASRARRGLSM